MSHIDGKHLDCSILQHAVCKSSCRRSHIGTYLSFHGYIKILHRLFQLKSSAADIRKCMSTDFDLNLFRKGSSRFILSLPVHEYIAGHDDRFCLFSGGCQISLYK